VPAGGLSPHHTRWIHAPENYFLPKKVLRKVFRGKFVDALKKAFQNGQLNFPANLKLLANPTTFAAWLRTLFRENWAWPSPTIAWSPLLMAKSLFVGAILLTATNKNSFPCLSMNS